MYVVGIPNPLFATAQVRMLRDARTAAEGRAVLAIPSAGLAGPSSGQVEIPRPGPGGPRRRLTRRP